MNRRLATLGGVAVILLIACGAFYYRRAGAPPAPSSTITVDGICLACKQPVSTTYTAGEPEPYACPLCKAHAVYPTYFCTACKLRVVPRLQAGAGGEPPRVPMIPICPVCGGAHLIGYIPEDPDHAQAKLGPLPPWPSQP